MDKSCESDVVLVLGWTIEMYLNGCAYAPSASPSSRSSQSAKARKLFNPDTGFHGPLLGKFPITVLSHTDKLTPTQLTDMIIPRGHRDSSQ